RSGARGRRRNWSPASVGRRRLEPVCGIAVLRPVEPEPPEGRSETSSALVPAAFGSPARCRAKVRQLPLEAAERVRAQVTHPRQSLTRVELFRDSEEVVVVAPTQRRLIREIAQLFESELSDRPQHEEAPVLAVAQEVLVDQRLQNVELCGADGFRRLELEAPGEHSQPCKQGLLTAGEEPVAPLDGPAQRALPLRCVVCAGRQQVQAATEALEDLVRCEALDARCGKLERERKALEALCYLTHRRIGLEVRLQLPCALREE